MVTKFSWQGFWKSEFVKVAFELPGSGWGRRRMCERKGVQCRQVILKEGGATPVGCRHAKTVGCNRVADK